MSDMILTKESDGITRTATDMEVALLAERDTLRQRVKVLETALIELGGISASWANKAKRHEEELATLKQAQGEPFGFITTDHAGCEVFTKTRFKLKGHEQFPVFTSAPTNQDNRQFIGYVTGASRTITDTPMADHSQPVFIIPLSAAPKPGEPTADEASA